MNQQQNATQIARGTLKKRGWNDALIEQILTPVKTFSERLYGRTVFITIYDIADVERGEQTEAFLAHYTKNTKRRDSARKAMDRRRAETLSEFNAIQVQVPQIDREQLIKRAVVAYNALWKSRGDYEKKASMDSAPEFLVRITVNYLRHELSHYEQMLDQAAGRIGADNARMLAKQKVLDAIAEQYPYLHHECNAQLKRATDDGTQPK